MSTSTTQATTTTATTTGQFQPSNTGYASNKGASVVLGNSLYYFVPDSDQNLKVIVCNLNSLVTKDDLSSLTNNDNWSNFMLKAKFSSGNGANFSTSYGTALTVCNNKIYFFWVDSNNKQLFGCWMDGFGNCSAYPYKVYTGGSANTISGSSLSANTFGNTMTLSWFGPSSLAVRTLLLDPKDISDTSKNWTSTQATDLTLSTYGVSVDNSYGQITSAWFSQGSLGNFMVTGVYSTNNHRAKFIAFPIGSDGAPSTTKANLIYQVNSIDCSRGIDLKCDAAGRIYLLTCDKNNHNLQSAFLNTFQSFAGVNSGSPANLSWSTFQYVNGIQKDSEKAPTAAFILSQNGVNGTVTLKNTQGQNASTACTRYNNYCLSLYAETPSSNKGDRFTVQGAVYGQATIVPNYNVMAPDPQYTDNYTMNVIMDPFPFPNQNVGGTNPGSSVAAYTYGTSSSTELRVDTAWQLLVGIKSSLSTSKGVGPAAESQFQTGPQGSLGASTQNAIFNGWTMNTPIVSNNQGQSIVSNKGRFDGHTLYNLSETAALFYDVNGVLINGTTAPLYSTIIPVPGHASYSTSGSYTVFASNPGDINSYSEANINLTMATKYNALASTAKSYFTSGYASNYIQDVIEQNCYSFNGSPYLEFTITPTGYDTTGFSQINQVLASIGWLVQGSMYAGVGFGEELSIFGFGEAISASLMVGFEYSLSVDGGITSSEEWGVTTDFDYQYSVPGSYRYTVRMYICKPNNMWAREIQYMASTFEDADEIVWDSSMPMKIMFVVTGVKQNS